jgi:hypothetical protein
MFLGLVLAAPVLFAQTAPDQAAAPDAAASTAPSSAAHKAPKQAVVLPPMPAGPLSQLPMDQIPPTPAKVTFQGGLLEISAQNATLGEILREVRKLTNASIEIPPGSKAASERVVTHLGPGAPRDVLAVLLNGSSFNYVMVGSSSDPTAVSSIILSAKPGESPNQTAANVYQNSPQPQQVPPNGAFPPRPFNRQFGQPGVAQPMPGQPNVQAANAQPAAEDEDLKEEDPDTPEDSAENQAQPGQPAQPDATDANTQAQRPDPNQPNAGPKTPEQIMEMLRRQQQPGGGAVPPTPQPPPQQ